MAAARNRLHLTPALLKSGANPDRKDFRGVTAEDVAKIYGFKGFADDLFVRRWYLKAETITPRHLNPPPMAFQMYDSKYPTWLYGDCGQIYLQKLTPAGEYLGTGLSAPRAKKTMTADST
nr:unnamed protein product [Spirometra erinaceieuropaei]